MRYIITIFITIMLCSGFRAHSQSSVSGTADISRIMNITVTTLAGVISFNDGTDYTSGQTFTNAATIAVKSNVLWLITVKAQSANFSSMTSGASTNMPASVLSVRRNGTSSWLTMSTTTQTLKTGGKGNASASGNTFNTDIELDPGFAYNAGTYTMGLTFTISEQ